ncbi:hypothetical protein VPHD239_0206 [Vibrio phage D239]
MSRNRRFTILILAVGYLKKSLRMAYRSFWEVYGIIKKLARYFPSQESCQLFSRKTPCNSRANSSAGAACDLRHTFEKSCFWAFGANIG